MRRRPFGALLVGASALLRESVARLLISIQFRILSSSPRLDLNLIGALPKDQSILLVVEASTAFDLAIEQIALFRAHHDAGRIIVLTDRRDPGDLAAVFKAGAQACLDSGATGADFMKSVNLLMLGETILPLQILDILSRVGSQAGGSITLPTATTEALADHATPHLSKREQRVLQCLLDGRSNKAMARVIGIAESTVKVHVKAILRKIRAQNRTQAAIWAMNHGSSLWSTDETPCAGEFDSLAGDINCTPTEARNGVRFATPVEITEQTTKLTSLGVKRQSPLDVGEAIRVLK